MQLARLYMLFVVACLNWFIDFHYSCRLSYFALCLDYLELFLAMFFTLNKFLLAVVVELLL